MDWLPYADELLVLPVENVAMFLLKRIARKPHQAFRAEKFTGINGEVLPHGEGYRQPAVKAAISEALDWLYVNGLIVGHSDSHQREQGFFTISRKGLAIVKEVEPLRLLRTERLLSLPLHPRIETKARIQFAIGAYGSAVFEAFRELEIRVRATGGYPAKTIGDDLMRLAFSPNGGPLSDPSLVFGEQRAVMELYAGAIGAFKNPLSHRVVDYDDPTIAAEQILFADLLHRMLDGFEAAKAEKIAET